MNLDPRDRARLAERVRGRLADMATGSTAELLGSLAWGGSDPFSDIDLLWEVPDDQFDWSIRNFRSGLSSLHPLESLRFDAALQESKKRRRVYVRFDGFPLYWHCDIDVFAQSIHRDRSYDVGNASARGPDRSAGESMLMGAVAAIRARIRGRPSQARDLLTQAFSRVGMEPPDLPGAQPILALVDEAERRYSELELLAGRVRDLLREGAAELAAAGSAPGTARV